MLMKATLGGVLLAHGDRGQSCMCRPLPGGRSLGINLSSNLWPHCADVVAE